MRERLLPLASGYGDTPEMASVYVVLVGRVNQEFSVRTEDDVFNVEIAWREQGGSCGRR